MQRLQVNHQLERDSTNITILNPDGGQFVLYIQNPNDGVNWQSPTLTTNMTAWSMNLAIRSYYGDKLSASIDVFKTMYDAEDNVTTVENLSVKNVFTIKVTKSLTKASTNLISVSKVSTASVIAVTLPKNY